MKEITLKFSDDAAITLNHIVSLKKLTGNTFGSEFVLLSILISAIDAGKTELEFINIKDSMSEMTKSDIKAK